MNWEATGAIGDYSSWKWYAKQAKDVIDASLSAEESIMTRKEHLHLASSLARSSMARNEAPK